MGGWMEGWMDGWKEGKAGLRIAYSNQKCQLLYFGPHIVGRLADPPFLKTARKMGPQIHELDF